MTASALYTSPLKEERERRTSWYRSQGSTDGDGSFPGEDTSDAMEVNGEAPGELIIDAMTRMPLKGFHCDRA